MVVGMDVYKDSSKKNMSVAAFIASMNGMQPNRLSCTQFYSKCQIQERGSEFSQGLQTMMTGNHAKFNCCVSTFFVSKLELKNMKLLLHHKTHS